MSARLMAEAAARSSSGMIFRPATSAIRVPSASTLARTRRTRSACPSDASAGIAARSTSSSCARRSTCAVRSACALAHDARGGGVALPDGALR